jgi:molybdopterin-guanine dinucleotide biosynthesis protein
MTSGGIFGPKLSGKTTLAKQISVEYWRRYKIRSLVLDLNAENWGSQAMMTTDETAFWQWVWKSHDSLIIVDEGTETIARDKTLIPIFTRLRHLRHKLLVIGHHGMNLLPIMREQLDTLYLFRQSHDAADLWAKTFTQDDLLAATRLQQYEFLHTTLYGKVRKYRLTLPGRV